MGRTTPNLKATRYLTALPWKNTARGNWHILSGGPYSWALCGVQTVTADEYEMTHDGRARFSALDDVTCRKCRLALRHLPTRAYPARVVEAMAHTENARRDREARVAATAARVAERDTRRAPKAIKLTAEQAAERRAATLAASAAAREAERARILALLAEQPVPEWATFVFDSETGEKVGWMSEAGIVPLPAPVDEVVIVPCGGAKLDTAAPAGDLYVGSYHQATRRAAAAIANRTGARVLILSALHGLLTLDQVVEPYNLRMGQPGSVTTDQVRQQAAALGVRAAHVTVLAGRAYADVVSAVWPDAVRPLDGTRGIGPQLARLKAITAPTEVSRAESAYHAERARAIAERVVARAGLTSQRAARAPLAGEQPALFPAPPLDLVVDDLRPGTRRRRPGRRVRRTVTCGLVALVGL